MGEATLAVIAPVALVLWAVWSIERHFRCIEGYLDPSLLGMVLEQASFDIKGPHIGQWGDHALYEFVIAGDRRFEFDRLVRPDYRYRVAPDELFVAPGMIYIAR
jgi:hypothetical protein